VIVLAWRLLIRCGGVRRSTRVTCVLVPGLRRVVGRVMREGRRNVLRGTVHRTRLQ
jgi:hypothetical protein